MYLLPTSSNKSKFFRLVDLKSSSAPAPLSLSMTVRVAGGRRRSLRGIATPARRRRFFPRSLPLPRVRCAIEQRHAGCSSNLPRIQLICVYCVVSFFKLVNRTELSSIGRHYTFRSFILKPHRDWLASLHKVNVK